MDDKELLKAIKWGMKEIHGKDLNDFEAQRVLLEYNKNQEND